MKAVSSEFRAFLFLFLFVFLFCLSYVCCLWICLEDCKITCMFSNSFSILMGFYGNVIQQTNYLPNSHLLTEIFSIPRAYQGLLLGKTGHKLIWGQCMFTAASPSAYQPAGWVGVGGHFFVLGFIWVNLCSTPQQGQGCSPLQPGEIRAYLKQCTN